MKTKGRMTVSDIIDELTKKLGRKPSIEEVEARVGAEVEKLERQTRAIDQKLKRSERERR